MILLTINAGSSSIKYTVFKSLKPLLSGLIEGIGEQGGLWNKIQDTKISEAHTFSTHKEAFEVLATYLENALQGAHIEGIGHRVVHGGSTYFKPTVITKELLNAINQLSPLAPIHNPVNLEGIVCAQNSFPKATHIAVFDTGFHHTLPEYAYRYAIDKAVADNFAVRRYGFHGINHEYVATTAANFLNKPLSNCNLITLHLGNGASACLIKQGQSKDTSMGMTPLAGLIMGTRSGDIDPAIILYLQRQGFSLQAIDTLLNKQSGLMGIAEDNDMRRICARKDVNDALATLAIEMYVYSIQKTIGAYISQTPKLDALVFTGGVGENAQNIREEIITPLSHLGLKLNLKTNRKRPLQSCENIGRGRIPILVIRADEEFFIAKQVSELLL